MLIFLANGKLGNQIFQYLFLKKLKKEGELILTSGFEELKTVFEIDDLININIGSGILKNYLLRMARPFTASIVEKGLINGVRIIREDLPSGFSRESNAFRYRKGKLKKVTFIYPGFFQSEAFFNPEDAYKLKIRRQYIDAARTLLADVPASVHRVFVHIRRGDYACYTVMGKSVMLPLSYFKEQINYFTKVKKNPFFIFFSDDPKFVEKAFSYLDNKLISTRCHFGTDLAAMTMCHSAILSPSSFGWWGAYLMKNRDTIIAPKYWLGFASGIEYHKGSLPNFVRPVEVK